MKEYLEKYDDLFGLSLRIKEIDSNYLLLLNKKLNRVEVHNTNQPITSFVCVAKPLDARLIVKLKRTRSEVAYKFFAELDDFNENLKQQKMQELTQKTYDINHEIANYSFTKNRDLTDNEIKKIINN